MKKQVRIAAIVALLALGGFSANAQQITAGTSIGKQANTGLNKADTYVEVIDRKGTRKFLQAKNGLTTWTDTAPDGGEVTTWQLGGTLTEDTYIDATGKVFGIKGIKAIDATANPVTDIAATVLGTTATPSTGYSIMVRDEATGETKKILAADLLQVQGFYAAQAASADNTDLAITVTGIKATASPYKVFVFRNGAKLMPADYTITADTVTVLAATPIYNGDSFEVHYIK